MKSGILIHPEELSKKWIDRMAAQGIDILGLHPVGGHDAYKTLSDMLALFETDAFRVLIDYAKSQGLEIEYETHAMGYLLNRSLFSVHPEYFRMNKDGDRVCDFNFCVSNRDALQAVAENAVKLADKLYGSNENYYFWFDDVKDGCCHCEKCRQLSPSDQQLIVVNAMINEIRKRKPNARMAYLAYQDTLAIPRKTVKAPGVFLEYAPMDKGRKDDSYSESVAYELSMRAPLIEFFGAEHARVLEYFLDNSLFSDWKKPPKRLKADKDEIARDVKEYARLGFKDIATFGCYLGSDYEALYGAPDITPFTDVMHQYAEK